MQKPQAFPEKNSGEGAQYQTEESHDVPVWSVLDDRSGAACQSGQDEFYTDKGRIKTAEECQERKRVLSQCFIRNRCTNGKPEQVRVRIQGVDHDPFCKGLWCCVPVIQR